MANKTPRLSEGINTVGDKSITNSSDTIDSPGFILDRDWAKVSFLLAESTFSESADKVNRFYSVADEQFTDTSIGGSIGVNPKPQYCRYSDIRSRGRVKSRSPVNIGSNGKHGVGRYYEEAVNVPQQRIYLRFGVPQFNSLMSFLSNAYEPEKVTIARTGRSPSIWFNAGKIAGTVAGVYAFPMLALYTVGVKIKDTLVVTPTSKYYTLKPTMLNYWNTVNFLANQFAVNYGIFPKIPFVPESKDDQKLGQAFKMDSDHMKMLHALFPDIISSQGYIDVLAAANKAQRAANRQFVEEYKALDNQTATDYIGSLKKIFSSDMGHKTNISNEDGTPTTAALLNKMLMFSSYFMSEDSKQQAMEKDPRLITSTDSEGNQVVEQETEPGVFREFLEHFDAEFRDGSQFAIFNVDHTGSVGESFSNAVGESDVSQKINQISSQVRQLRFGFADGNLSNEGISGMLNDALGAVKDVALGAISGFTMGVSDKIFAALNGSGYLDIPKYWQSSSASLPRSSYSIKLRSPYNNFISQMQNLYIPLFMLMAGALPLSTGKHSYTSPYICQLFDRGRCQGKTMMIESLQVTRGTTTLAFDTKGHALGIDVTINFVDLSSIMHMPVSTASIFGPNLSIDQDNILSDYLAVLAGQDIYSQIYNFPKAKIALAKEVARLKALTSPAYWAGLTHEIASNTLIVGNILEAGVRGSGVTTQ